MVQSRPPRDAAWSRPTAAPAPRPRSGSAPRPGTPGGCGTGRAGAAPRPPGCPGRCLLGRGSCDHRSNVQGAGRPAPLRGLSPRAAEPPCPAGERDPGPRSSRSSPGMGPSGRSGAAVFPGGEGSCPAVAAGELLRLHRSRPRGPGGPAAGPRAAAARVSPFPAAGASPSPSPLFPSLAAPPAATASDSGPLVGRIRDVGLCKCACPCCLIMYSSLTTSKLLALVLHVTVQPRSVVGLTAFLRGADV